MGSFSAGARELWIQGFPYWGLDYYTPSRNGLSSLQCTQHTISSFEHITAFGETARHSAPLTNRFSRFILTFQSEKADKLMRGLFPCGRTLLSGILIFTWSAASIASQPSTADCAAEADHASRVVGSGHGSVGHSAVKGAIFGSILGDRKSARRGAAPGRIAGGVRRGIELFSIRSFAPRSQTPGRLTCA